MWEEVGDPSQTLRQQTDSDPAGIKKLAAIHAKLILSKKKTNFLGEARRVSWMEDSDVRVVVDVEQGLLDTAGARIVELKDRCVEANFSFALC